MKKLMKCLITILVVTVLMSMATGCSKKKKETEEKRTVVTSNANIETDQFVLPIPEGWLQQNVETLNGVTTITKDTDKSISCLLMDTTSFQGMDINEYKNVVENNLKNQEVYGVKVNRLDVKHLPCGDAVYVETYTKATKELLDISIESGALTQSVIEAAGGVEDYLKMMEYSQMGIYVLKDNKLLMLTAQMRGTSIEDIRDEAMYVFEHVTIK